MSSAYYQAPQPQGAPESGQVILRDGSTAYLRPATPQDKDLLVDFLGRISRESYVRRFYAETPPEAAATRMLAPELPETKLVLFVLTGEPDHPRLIATGEYARETPQSDAAEVAFLVDDAVHGKGLGTLLLERLALVAARHGITRFTALTMARNRPMLSMFNSSGFKVERRLEYGDVELDFSILPSRESVARAELRERVATVASLYPFFKPRAVAVLGASASQGSASQRVLKNLRESGFAGGIYLVNPNLGEAHPSLEALPERVDLAVLALPKDAVLAAVDACGAAGVRALVVISAGFAEAGEAGRALQEELAERVRGYGMRLVGPNSLGLISGAPMNASLAPRMPLPGGVAISSQSGALGLAALEHAREAQLGLSSFVSLGNKADVSGNDLLQYWEDDPTTKVILLYLASFGNPRRFARLARRVGRKKPILAVKAGRGGSGADEAVAALFRQTGVVRAQTFEEMLELATLLAHQPLPAGPRVGVLTNASGPAALAVDTLLASGLELPTLTPEEGAHLTENLPEGAMLTNPLDLSAFATAEHYRAALKYALGAPAFDALLVLFSPVGPSPAEEVAAVLAAGVQEARGSGNPKPVLLCFTGAHPPAYAGPERLPCYPFPESAARSLGRAHEYAHWRREPLGETPNFPDLDVSKAREVLRAPRTQGGGWLLPEEAVGVLEAFGVPFAPSRFVADADGAAQAAEALGYPVALKLASSSLVEKSLWDGVKLDVQDAEAVRRACEAILARLRDAGKEGALEGFWVQRMVPGGTELSVGVKQDPLFGPLLSFGLGGLYTEVLQDKAFRITPLTDKDAAEMLSSVRSFPLLVGYRGHPPSDLAAVQELLLRVSRLVEELPEILELELNPVKAFPPGEGALVLDARMRLDAPK